MSSNLSKVEYNGWQGGLNMLVDKTKVQKDQLQTATNVVILPNGVIASRPGIGRVKNILAETTTSCYSIWQGVTGKYCFHCADKTLRDGAGTTLKTYANDSKGQFAYFNSTLLHSNGVNTMQSWDLAAATSSDVAGSPVSSILLKHNDRIFAVTGSVLYETKVNTAIDFAGGAAWNVGLGEGGSITGLAAIQSDLFIFKHDRIYRMSGYTQAERQIVLFADKIGTDLRDTVKTVTLEGLGEAIIFVSQNYKLCVLNLLGWQEIGEYVQPILSFIDSTNTKINSVVSSKFGFYLLTFGEQYHTPFSSYAKMCLCVNLKSPYKSEFGLRWGITTWYQPVSAATDFEKSFEAICESIDYEILFVSLKNQSGGIFILCKLSDTTYQDWDGDGVAGAYSAIPSIVRTRDEDSGNSDSVKQWRRLLLRIAISNCNPATTTITPTFSQITDETSTAKTSTETILSPTLTTAFGSVIERWIDLVNSARTCSNQFDFTVGVSLYGAFRISGITLFYKTGITPFYKKSQTENRK